ncbi:MAG: PLP-dependent aminotransferase family protein [Duodenibacillus sp.]|nr:PLP-dependent aminotransferase family protein [Duodenibacillus sp.]
MPRTSHPILGFEITLDRTSNITLDKQIAEAVRRAVQTGALMPGDLVTPIRQLAQYLNVARATVDAAYAELIAEGLLFSVRGRGTFVSSSHVCRKTSAAAPPAASAVQKPIADSTAVCVSALGYLMPQKNIPLAIVSTSADVSPRDFQAYFQRAAKKHLLDQVYDHPCGLPALREAIARIALRLRNVQCRPEQVVVTSGSQLGLMMAMMTLLNPGDRVCIENPAYPLLRAAGFLRGIDPVYAPVDAEGLDIEAARELCPNPRAIFLTPSNQCPLGVVMSMKRRRAILDWAQVSGAWVVEDDYDSELRYEGNLPFPALYGMDHGANVIYVGTFSKMLFPGLRLGYLIVPEHLVESFAGMRLILDRQSHSIAQHAVAEYIQDGFYEAHVRKMRQIFDTRYHEIRELVERDWGDWGCFISGAQGMHVTFRFHNQAIDDKAVFEACLEQGVETRYLSSFYAPGSSQAMRGLVLGFGFFNREQMLSAVSRIGFVLRHRFAEFGPA